MESCFEIVSRFGINQQDASSCGQAMPDVQTCYQTAGYYYYYYYYHYYTIVIIVT